MILQDGSLVIFFLYSIILMQHIFLEILLQENITALFLTTTDVQLFYCLTLLSGFSPPLLSYIFCLWLDW